MSPGLEDNLPINLDPDSGSMTLTEKDQSHVASFVFKIRPRESIVGVGWKETVVVWIQ